MANLYKLTDNLLKLQDLMQETDISNIIDTYEYTEETFEEKIENHCKIIKNLEGDLDGLSKEITRMSNKKKLINNNIQYLKKTMYESMKHLNKYSINGEFFKVSIQKNGGKAPIPYDKNNDEILTNIDHKYIDWERYDSLRIR